MDFGIGKFPSHFIKFWKMLCNCSLKIYRLQICMGMGISLIILTSGSTSAKVNFQSHSGFSSSGWVLFSFRKISALALSSKSSKKKKKKKLLPFFFFLINLFIYFWLCWVFVACGLSLVAVSGGYPLLRCAGFSLRWLLLLQSTGSRCTGFSSCGSWAQQLWLVGSRAQAQ